MFERVIKGTLKDIIWNFPYNLRTKSVETPYKVLRWYIEFSTLEGNRNWIEIALIEAIKNSLEELCFGVPAFQELSG